MSNPTQPTPSDPAEFFEPVIDEPQNPTEHNSGAARSSGEHDLPTAADEHRGPPLDEDTGDDRQPPDEGGDPEEPGAQSLRRKGVADSPMGPGNAPPAGPSLRLASEEVYY